MKFSAGSTVLAVSMACVAVAGAPQGAAGAGPRGVDLARLGSWDIVVDPGAIPSEVFAAEEFRDHFLKASGLKLPIVRTQRCARPRKHIFIGGGKAFSASAVGFPTEGFGEEDFRIIIRDDLVAITGGRPRGTLYGVYTFLEDYLGVRFLTADHTHIPPVGPWRVVGPVDRFYHPPLRMRWSYYGEVNRNPLFAARLRINTVPNDPKLGGRTGMININHSFYYLIPQERYGKEHPEYFALVGGRRLADRRQTQPCLTNPEVLKIVKEGVLRQIAQHPERTNVSVSQNDNANYCRCPKCAAIDKREGTPMGSLLTFVNAVADEVAKRYPNVDVGTLSYWYSRKPPRTLKPRPNVQIQLCSIECCLLHPIDDPNCPLNVAFCRDLRGWSRICKKISIWNYNTNFSNYLLPCPNLRVIEKNIRFFVANHALGIFMQAAGNAVGAEFSELRNYLISRLLWNPNLSGEAVINEFLSLHYGRAAPPIKRYIDLIHDAALRSGLHRNCFARKASQYGIDQSLAPKAIRLFEEALSLAESKEVRRRVEKASIAAYRLAIEPLWGVRSPDAVPPSVLKSALPALARFIELCDRYGVDRVAEVVPYSKVRPTLVELLKRGSKKR